MAEIVAGVATLQLFGRACDATKEYLANEIKVGMSVYSVQVSWSMRFAQPSICRQNLSQGGIHIRRNFENSSQLVFNVCVRKIKNCRNNREFLSKRF